MDGWLKDGGSSVRVCVHAVLSISGGGGGGFVRRGRPVCLSFVAPVRQPSVPLGLTTRPLPFATHQMFVRLCREQISSEEPRRRSSLFFCSPLLLSSSSLLFFSLLLLSSASLLFFSPLLPSSSPLHFSCFIHPFVPSFLPFIYPRNVCIQPSTHPSMHQLHTSKHPPMIHPSIPSSINQFTE